MKRLTLFLLLSVTFTSLKAQLSKTPHKSVSAAKPAKIAKVPAPPKVDTVVAVPKQNLPSINIDKYNYYDNEDLAIKEIDSLYPHTTFEKIENVRQVLYSRKFKLVAHLIRNYEVMPNIDYLYDLNEFNFVCGVGLKRTKDVSPACMQPRVYEANINSENKVKLAALVLSKGIKADKVVVTRCVTKNEFELFKLLYTNLIQGKTDPKEGYEYLADAAYNGCYDIVKYLLENNVSAKGHADGSDFYCIYRAVAYPEIFNLFVEHGGDIRVEGYHNTTPIVHAAREGCIEVLQYLLDKGIDPYEKHGDMSAYDMAKRFNLKNKKEVLALFKNYKGK